MEMFLDKFEFSRQLDQESQVRVREGVELHYSRTFSDNRDLSARSSELCEYVSGQAHFIIALHDSGFVPRFLDFLLGFHSLAANNDWGNQLFNDVYGRYGTVTTTGEPGSWRGFDDIRTVISLAITRQVIQRAWKLPSGASIGEVERDGLLFLSSVQDGFAIVMPFVMLKVLNEVLGVSPGGRIIPSDLLLIPTQGRPWRWQDFERFHGHYQALLIGSLIDLKEATQTTITWRLSDVFRGAKGRGTLLGHLIRLRRLGVYTEKHKFLSTTTDIAAPEPEVLCDDGVSRDLTYGIFQCATNCVSIDHRWALDSPSRLLVVFMQDKFSHIDTKDPTITETQLLTWYNTTHASVRLYSPVATIILVLFTVRNVNVEDLSRMPQLILIDHDCIEDYLTPTFARRGLIEPTMDDAEDQVLTQPMDTS
jgi:hypothetical protein